jgi:hypothetical protein
MADAVLDRAGDRESHQALRAVNLGVWFDLLKNVLRLGGHFLFHR